MRILITGSTGLIGSALVPHLSAAGHSIGRLVRRTPRSGEIRWDPAAGRIDAAGLEGYDAVVHLAGHNIAAGRWTASVKQKICASRVEGTRLLAEALARLAQIPKVLVCASAIGYYGDRADEVLKEESSAGKGFLPDVAVSWEAAARPAEGRGIRVVWVRTGIVLTPKGGALARMLTPFKLGLGGRAGSGRQWWSWIAMDDLLEIYRRALEADSLAGAVNAVAPNPVTNAEFTKTLGRVFRRPTVFPVPAFVLKLVFGEMAEALLLASARVAPARLASLGFGFRFGELEPALRHLLGR